jgi:tRNA(fMet)-specific endonuclease VapC
MLYVLDTNICRLLIEEQPAVLARIDSLNKETDTVVTTVVSFDESVSGWLPLCHRDRPGLARANAYTNLLKTQRFYCRMLCLSYDEKATAIFDQLRSLKQKIGANDLAIAAITLSVSGTLITRNFADFERVPGLLIEDWTK